MLTEQEQKDIKDAFKNLSTIASALSRQANHDNPNSSKEKEDGHDTAEALSRTLMMTEEENQKTKKGLADISTAANAPSNDNSYSLEEGKCTVDECLADTTIDFSTILTTNEAFQVLTAAEQEQLKKLVENWFHYLINKEYAREEPQYDEDHDIEKPWDALNWAVHYFKNCASFQLDSKIMDAAQRVIDTHSSKQESASKRVPSSRSPSP